MRVTGFYLTGALVGVLAVACGGTTASAPGNDAGASGSSSSGGGSSSGVSSSSGSGASSGSSSGPSDDAGPMTGPGGMNYMIGCLNSAGCNSGEVCCGTASQMTVKTACAATCGGGGFQLCAMTSDCANPSDVCTSVGMGASICTPGSGRRGRDAGPQPPDMDAGPSTSDAGLTFDASHAPGDASSDGASE